MTKSNPSAALYLRSSKDRSDVSIDAQRRRLMELAAERGYLVTQEYTDVVESAKSEFRPGFQTLLRDLASPARQWSILLMLDHSRLSRQQYVGPIFAYEAQRKGVKVDYAMVPDLDPITRVIMDSVLDAFSVIHSLMSKEKGLAGMSENVRRGFRAGGRAPRGYKLEHIDTGVIRDGESVNKSRLATSEDAPLVARYLKARAEGTTRAAAIKQFDIPWTAASCVDLEWNALTYAGHTVWSVRAEKNAAGGYKGGKKRKPRAEWMIQKDTHDALITTDEAERIIGQLEAGLIGQAVSEAKAGNSAYLLTGLLKAPDGRDWIGDGRKHYRLKAIGPVRGKWLRMQDVDDAVSARMMADIRSEEFVRRLADEARRANAALQDDSAKPLRQQVAAINTQISKASDLAIQLEDPAPMLRKIAELETRRRLLVDEITRLEREQQAAAVLAQVTDKQVETALDALAKDFEVLPKERWKELIRSLVDRIELDPESLECRIHYRIAVEDRLCMASPRVGHSSPVLRAVAVLMLAA